MDANIIPYPGSRCLVAGAVAERCGLPINSHGVKSNVTSLLRPLFCERLKGLRSENFVATLSAAQCIATFCGFLSLLLNGVVTGHTLIPASLF